MSATEERLCSIEEKVRILVDGENGLNTLRARLAVEVQKRTVLEEALRDILPMAKLWMQPCEPGHPGWKYLDKARAALGQPTLNTV